MVVRVQRTRTKVEERARVPDIIRRKIRHRTFQDFRHGHDKNFEHGLEKTHLRDFEHGHGQNLNFRPRTFRHAFPTNSAGSRVNTVVE